MDCKTARLLGEFRGNRNSELPAEDVLHLDQHVQSCSACRQLQLIEQRIDAPIAKAMRAVPIPPGLKAKIIDRLATQRGAWYRKRIFYAAAAAASVMLAVGVLTWKPDNRAKLDLNGLVINGPSIENPKDKIDIWLSSQGIRYQPPVALNPNLLAFHGMTTIQGKQVPTVIYRVFGPDGAVNAQVYIIRDTDFDLSTLPDTFSGSSAQGYHVEIHRDADQGSKIAYVILFKGDSLEPFLIKFSST